MALAWVSYVAEVQHARHLLEDGEVVMLQVESLLDGGWHWHVWDSAGLAWSRHGIAETAQEARTAAEGASNEMLAELALGDHGPTARNGRRPH